MFGLTDECFLPARSGGRWEQVDMINKVRIEYGGQRNDISFTASGSGCRYIETAYKNKNQSDIDWYECLTYLLSYKGDGVNISRLDIACDDKNEVLEMRKIMNAAKNEKYVSRTRVKPERIEGRKEIVYFGSEKSKTRLRIYNKALERGVEEKWIRCELQLRDDAADSFISNLQEYKDIGRTFSGVLNNYLRFTTKNPSDCNGHYDDLKITKWWTEYIGTAEKIKNVKSVGLEYNYEHLENLMKKNYASSIKAFLLANDGNISALLDIVNGAKLNNKQKEMLNEIEHVNADSVEGW